MGRYLNKNDDHDQTTGELEPSPEAKFEYGVEKGKAFLK